MKTKHTTWNPGDRLLVVGQDPYGPETPGYAHLDEQARRAAGAIKPAKQSRAKKVTSHTDETKPKAT